jgi:hypothetical protein
MANQVTITKIEYSRLKREAKAYRRFVVQFFQTAILEPIEDVIEDFRKTNLYTKEFLLDLEDGLRKSSYAKSHGIKSASRRS